MIFESPSQFSIHIENLATQSGESYLTTIAEFCDENLIDYDEVVKMISPTLRQKIKEQSSAAYSMPKDTTFTLE